ncbi:MAG: MobA/MobL family protein [Rhizorhabdus sp.]|uniref:MobA/MobL family protein n=1 Tax=Rhizorhabdus sp. TaxID=1968843 RepID=UPI001B5FAE4D|nr:MobA/MobL family protein [Rhizorhabdus sp.]MBP8231108.1 MobA/MobL family protein [Rhizorhabdus sp.]
MVQSGRTVEEDWFKRAGRLVDEEGQSEKYLLTGRYASMSRGAYKIPQVSSSRGRSDAGGVPFYMHISHAGKGKAGRQVKLADAARQHPERLYVMPPRGQKESVEQLGGGFDRRAGCWWVPKDRCGREEARRLGWRGQAAVRQWSAGGRGRGTAGSAVRYQQYVNRADDPARREEVMTDEDGPLAFGSLGRTEDEQFAFWEAREEAEKQGGRVQARVTFEIPHELLGHPNEVRRALEEFVALFARRGVPFHVAVHRPDKNGDRRNLHAHLVYSDRRVLARPAPGARTSPAGDRAADWAEVAELVAAGVRKRSTMREMDDQLSPLGAALCSRRSGSLGVVFRGEVRDALLIAKAGGAVTTRRALRELWAGAAAEAKAVRRRDLGWVFEREKDRSLQGADWVKLLRSSWAEAANRSLVRVTAPEHGLPARFYDPRSYRAMGVEKRPSEHLGSWRTALERAGVPTMAGIRNMTREIEYRRWNEERTLRCEVEQVERVVADGLATARRGMGYLTRPERELLPLRSPLIDRNAVAERAADHGRAVAMAGGSLAEAVADYVSRRQGLREGAATWETKTEIATSRARNRQAWARGELEIAAGRERPHERRRVARLTAILDEARAAEAEIREGVGRVADIEIGLARDRDRIVRRREDVARLAAGQEAYRFALDWLDVDTRVSLQRMTEEVALAARRLGISAADRGDDGLGGSPVPSRSNAAEAAERLTHAIAYSLRPDTPGDLVGSYVGAFLGGTDRERALMGGTASVPPLSLLPWWDGSLERWAIAARLQQETVLREGAEAEARRAQVLELEAAAFAKARAGALGGVELAALRRRIESARLEEDRVLSLLASPGQELTGPRSGLVGVHGFSEAIAALAARRGAWAADFDRRPGPRGSRDRDR